MRLSVQRLVLPPTIDAHDLVRVPDGRVGEVIGFYRRELETVLVQFASGASLEFLTADVRRSP
jgi:hypothetical protein